MSADQENDDPALHIGPTSEHGYWRSLRELEGTAKIQETGRTNREFPPGAGEDRPIDPLHRRNFFQLMGASMALAGVSACRYEKEEIVPLARRPEDQTPGQATQYATVYDLGGVAQPLLATSYEGRPIHLEGNAEHPWNGGGIVEGTTRHAGISTFVQASILHLYDPDRSKNVSHDSKGSTLDAFRTLVNTLRKGLGGTTRVLAEASSSPTLHRMKRDLLATGVQWHEYEPISFDNEREGLREVFDRPVRPIAKLDKCNVIVTLDADIFGDHPSSARYSRDFAKSRRMDGTLGTGKMNRLWSVESQFTPTGAMADHRLGIRSEHVLPFVKALANELAGGGAKVESSFLGDQNVRTFLTVLASDIKEHKQRGGKTVVVAGRRQPPEVHGIVAQINAQIGAVGDVLEYYEAAEPERPSHAASIQALAKDLEAAGKVQTLIILGGNPVYDAPADLNFGALLAKVPESIHLSEYNNETSLKSKWHVPKAHYLEAWGDARTFDGTYTLAQPLIAPLFGGISSIELISMLLGNEQGGEALVKHTFEKTLLFPITNWRASVAAGFVAAPPQPAQVGAPKTPRDTMTESQKSGSSKRSNGDIEVTFAVSPFSYDGRFANNAWLQEPPDFLSKVTWDNFALVGPETAKICGVENDTMIKIAVNGKSVEVPCYTIPGQARGTVTLVLGGGRTAAGKVGNKVGFDTNVVRTVAGFDISLKATVTSTGTEFELASVQEHWDIRTGISPKLTQEGIAERLPALVRENTAAELVREPSWRAEREEEFFNDLHLGGDHDRKDHGGFSLFKEKDYGDHHRWGMAIDLSTCTGCNSCMVACQSENNIPVVGKEEVKNNREMSWIRIDRYFKGSPDDPQVAHQPVACQHCEQAPCEQVCPVGATTHSDEGLNDMAYNRCIGTRYCANNCPYKVRRFNFLDWNKEFRDARAKVRRLLFNPEVTVRMRGVMEKCSFCVQRIQNAKIKQKAEAPNRGNWPPNSPDKLVDGTVVAACQAACPTECITFGDLSIADSRVSKAHKDRRSYGLLPETYAKPRNRYLARVRNPHPRMPGAGGVEQKGHGNEH